VATLGAPPSQSTAPLTLRPFAEADRAALETLLAQPRLYRRRVAGCVCEKPNIGWHENRRTFVVTHGPTTLGVAELVRDEDELDVWSMAVTLDHHAHQGDGGRCAAALVDYAFRVLEAAGVWFWVRRDNIAVQRFGARLGFTCLFDMKVPGGEPAEYFEVDRTRWALARPAALTHYLRHPVEITDGVRRFRGAGADFLPVDPPRAGEIRA
jgi:GNAT superfamily N-acetyltransferase